MKDLFKVTVKIDNERVYEKQPIHRRSELL